MLSENTYDYIYQTILPFVPEGWRSIVYFVFMQKDSFSMQYYYETPAGEYIQCFEGKMPSRSMLKAFREIEKFIGKQRTEEDTWTNMTVIFQNDGRFHADFDYTDLSEDRLEYMKLWKIKYLK